MKKFLLGMLVGVFLLKGSHTLYSYSWWSAEATPECRAVRLRDPHDWDKLMSCIHGKMGAIKYLEYPNANLTYTFQQWQLYLP